MNKVFISFSFRDRGFVCNLCENLRLLGLPIWFSLLEIDQNKWLDDVELKRMLEEALKGCDAVMIFVSDYSIGSTWVALELEVARKEQCKVIPFVDQMLRIPMPSHIQDHNPIRFNSGYKTALSQLFLRLNPAGKNVKGIAIEDNLTSASRTYANGETLSNRLGQTAIPESVKLFLLAIREFIATPKHVLRRFFESNAPSPSDIWQFALIIAPSYSQVDNIVRGNTLRIPDLKEGQGWTVLFSFLPLFNPNKLPKSPLQTLLISAWPSQSSIGCRETISMGIVIRDDDSGRIWVASQNSLSRFSLGSSDVQSHLLTPSLKMGAAKYVFQWPWREPDSQMLATMQRMNNLLGKGMVEVDLDLTLQDNGLFDHARDRLVDEEKWKIPLLGQSDCLWSFLANGGFLYYAEASGVPKLISSQIKHFCEAAEGVFIRKEDDASGIICMCIDSYQAHFFER